MKSAAALAVGLYALQGAEHALQRNPEHLLWLCHLALLVLALGLARSSPSLVGVGFLWLFLGLPLYVVNIASGGLFRLASVVSHLGGLVLGAWGVRQLGMPAGTWWKALTGAVGVWLLCRVITPPAANVNLAHSVWQGWEERFPSYAVYATLLTAAAALSFYAAESASRRWIGAAGTVRD